jgi:hypothetical protein
VTLNLPAHPYTAVTFALAVRSPVHCIPRKPSNLCKRQPLASPKVLHFPLVAGCGATNVPHAARNHPVQPSRRRILRTQNRRHYSQARVGLWLIRSADAELRQRWEGSVGGRLNGAALWLWDHGENRECVLGGGLTRCDGGSRDRVRDERACWCRCRCGQKVRKRPRRD